MLTLICFPNNIEDTKLQNLSIQIVHLLRVCKIATSKERTRNLSLKKSQSYMVRSAFFWAKIVKDSVKDLSQRKYKH